MRQVSFEFAAKSAGFRKSSDAAGMREAAEKQSRLGSTDNGSTELNAKSREGIPAVLPSLQASGACEAARAEPLRLLDERVLPERRRDAGRAQGWTLAVPGEGRADAGGGLRLRPAP